MAKSDDPSDAVRAPRREPDREARLAAALRANLARRKVAVRAAAAGPTPRASAGDEPSQ